MKPREEGGWQTLPGSLAPPAPPKNSSQVPGARQHSRAWGVVPAQTQHKQHPLRVHRHRTGKSLGDWNFWKRWKKGIAQYYLLGILLGTYDLKQNQGGNSLSLHRSFIMWAKRAGPCGCNPWSFPLRSPGMLWSAQRSKRETKACVKTGWNERIQYVRD